jgi:hypothetical protein
VAHRSRRRLADGAAHDQRHLAAGALESALAATIAAAPLASTRSPSGHQDRGIQRPTSAGPFVLTRPPPLDRYSTTRRAQLLARPRAARRARKHARKRPPRATPIAGGRKPDLLVAVMGCCGVAQLVQVPSGELLEQDPGARS